MPVGSSESTDAGAARRAVARHHHKGGGGRAVDGGDGQQGAAVDRGMRGRAVSVQHVAEQSGQVRVGVEAEHRVGLGQRLGEFRAVALRQAAHCHHLRPGVGGGQHRVDGVLLGGLDEGAGVHHDHVGRLLVPFVQQGVAAGGQSAGDLGRVDLVARAAERQQGDAGAGHPSRVVAGRLATLCTWLPPTTPALGSSFGVPGSPTSGGSRTWSTATPVRSCSRSRWPTSMRTSPSSGSPRWRDSSWAAARCMCCGRTSGRSARSRPIPTPAAAASVARSRRRSSPRPGGSACPGCSY